MGTRGAPPVVAKLELCPECLARLSENLQASLAKVGLKRCGGNCNRFLPENSLFKYGEYGFFCEDCSAKLNDG